MDEFESTDTAEQAAAKKKLAEEQARANETAIADFKWLMADVRGRRIVWRQLGESGVFASSYHPTAMQMAFNEGKRNDGIKLLAKVHEHCPDLYSTMMKEQQK